MGCCASRHERLSVGAYIPESPQAAIYELQEIDRQSLNLNVAGLQVEINSAGWLSGTGLNDLVTVLTSKDILLLSLFDWHGTPSAASYCARNIRQAFLELLGPTNDVEGAMHNILTELDTRILSSKQMTAEEKASSYASGCIVALDVKNLRIFTVRSGGSAVAVGKLVHGLATQLTEAAFIHRPKDPLSGANALQSDLEGMASCIGRLNLASPKGDKCFEPVQEQPVTVHHEHIILGSAGLWQTLTADDAALRSHFLLKASFRNGQQNGKDISKQPNMATQLIAYAQAQSARYESQGWNVRPCDLTCLIITLKWPATSLNQAFPRKQNFVESLAQEVDRQSLGGESKARLYWRRVRMVHVEFARARRSVLPPDPNAIWQTNWHALRRKWMDVVAAAIKQGKARARQLEETYWAKYQAAVTVTMSGKVIDSKGQAFMPTRLEAKAG